LVLLNNAMQFFPNREEENTFLHHITFFYFSRNYLAHNYFNTKENFEKMFDDGKYTPIKELYKSIVIIAFIIEWKKNENSGD